MALNKAGRKILKRLRQRYGTGKGVRIQGNGPAERHYLNCPFHQERTASFVLRIDDGVYYCLGCHEKGDIYKLAKQHPELLGRPKPNSSIKTTDPLESEDNWLPS